MCLLIILFLLNLMFIKYTYMDVKRELELYKPFNSEEEKDKDLMLACLKYKNVFTRENKLFHFTSSGYLLNEEMDSVLFCFHNIYQSYSWLGGHCDGDTDLLSVAIKEVKEESGLKNIKVFDKNIFSIEVLPVSGHYKRGEYVSSHLHLNVTYLLIGDMKEKLKIKEDENSSLKWIPLEEIKSYSKEEWMISHIYDKLNKKIELIKQGIKK